MHFIDSARFCYQNQKKLSSNIFGRMQIKKSKNKVVNLINDDCDSWLCSPDESGNKSDNESNKRSDKKSNSESYNESDNESDNGFYDESDGESKKSSKTSSKKS